MRDVTPNISFWHGYSALVDGLSRLRRSVTAAHSQDDSSIRLMRDLAAPAAYRRARGFSPSDAYNGDFNGARITGAPDNAPIRTGSDDRKKRRHHDAIDARYARFQRADIYGYPSPVIII